MRYRIQGAGCRVQGAGAGGKVQGAGCRMQDAGGRVHVGCKSSNAVGIHRIVG